MPIRIPTFGGIFPKLAPEKLPDGGAQIAKNVDLTSGVLSPINALSPFLKMNDGTNLNAGLAAADVISITAPGAPVWASNSLICGISTWLQIVGKLYWTHVDAGSNELQEENADVTVSWTDPDDVQFNDQGVVLTTTLSLSNSGDENLLADTTYNIFGPIFQFQLAADVGGVAGGPEAAINLPKTMFRTMGTIPGGSIPLFDGSNVYAYLQAIDYAGPIWTAEAGPYSALTDYDFPGDKAIFTIDLNYVEPRQRHYHFVRTRIQNTTLEESPPSDLSELVTVGPGEKPTLTITRTGGYNAQRLYRSGIDGGDFKLIDELTADSWTDDNTGVQDVDLPFYGNYAGSLNGSFMHPAQFGVAFSGSTVYLSDPFRVHAWPTEYTVEFSDSILAIALAGGTIIVFTGTDGDEASGDVWALSGSNPAALATYRLSDSAPMVGMLNMCQLDTRIFWASLDGMMMTNGSSIENITKNHYTRDEWKTWLGSTPEDDITSETADNSIFLTHAGGDNLRFDMDETLTALTTWTAKDSVSLTYKTKKFRLEREEFLNKVFAIYDAEVTLSVWVDGVEATGSPYTLALANSGKTQILSGMTERGIDFEYQVVCADKVRHLEFIERKSITIDDRVRLTDENVASWHDIWLKFPDRDRLVGGWISYQQGVGVVDIDIYDAGSLNGDLLATVDGVANGNYFTVPRTVAENDYNRIVVRRSTDAAAGPFDPISVDELVLFTRRSMKSSGHIQETHPGGVFPPWLSKRYELGGRRTFTSGIVYADSYPVTLNIYKDGASSATKSPTVSNNKEFRIDSLALCNAIDIDFGGTDDHKVNEIILFERSVIPIEAPGLIMRQGAGEQNWRQRLMEFKETGSFRAARVVADSYTNMALILKAAGATVATINPSSNDDFKLADDLAVAREWEFDLYNTSTSESQIYELLLFGRVRHEVKGGRVVITRANEPFSWLGHQIVNVGAPISFDSLRVEADAYTSLTVKLYHDGNLKKTFTITSNAPVRVPRYRPERTWEIDVTHGEGVIVHEVALATSMGKLRR